MKIFPAILCGLSLALSLPEASARERLSFVREMTVNDAVQAQFEALYPDLAEEQEVVSRAARELASAGEPTSRTEAAAALASRARALLAERTPHEWQRKAVSLYPELGVADSEFNRLFLQRYQEMKTTSPQFEDEPSWPVLLAKRCADELRTRTAPAPVADGTPSDAVKATPIESRAPPTPSVIRPPPNWWLSALSLLILGVILCLPALWLLRISRAFAGGDEPVTLWQKALRPGAWTYLLVAFVALARTHSANADLGIIDRFGITLLVSILAGGFFAPFAFLIAWAVAWWQRSVLQRAELLRTAGPVPTDRVPHESVSR